MFQFFGTDIVVLLHLLLVDDGKFLQIVGHLALFVHLDDVFYLFQGDGEDGGRVVIVRIPNDFLENVDFIVDTFAFLGFEYHI